ncbi:ABC transporter permease family protein [Jatrophihabitans fulvus]
MADTLTRPAARASIPVQHPSRLRTRLPRSAWVLVGGAVVAGIGALLPWFAPSGRVDAQRVLRDRSLGGTDLIGVGFGAALALGAIGVVAAVVVATGRDRLPGGLDPRRAIAWTALVVGLVALAGLYFDWRDVPSAVGVSRTDWDNASVNGYDLGSGARAGVWLVLAGCVVATLAAAHLLKIVLRVVALAYLGGLVALPVFTVVQRTFASGAGTVWDVVTSDPEFLAAVRLTAVVAGIAVVANTVFGVGMALLLTRYEFRGRRLLNTFIDLPLAISPVVVGVALVLVFGQTGWFGPALEDIGVQVIFSTPGMVLGTVIVALPLVIREVVPVLEESGTDQEQAARSLGAGGWQTFRRITLPTIKWALAYGVVLSLARSIGEFGAVRVVSQSVSGQSQTVTLWINNEYEQLGNEHKDNAFIGSFALMVVAVVFIVAIALLRPKGEKV